MSGYHDDTEVPEADGMEQQRDPLPELKDPEQTVSARLPEGIEADPADVLDQATEVRADDEDERSEE